MIELESSDVLAAPALCEPLAIRTVAFDPRTFDALNAAVERACFGLPGYPSRSGNHSHVPLAHL